MATISGTDNAFMFGLAGVLRAGAGRAGYHSSSVYITVAGTDRTTKARMGSLTINDNLDQEPNTAQIRFTNDFTPAIGDAVIIQLGSTGNAERLFGGRILSTRQVYEGGDRQSVVWECGLIDYNWELNQKLVRGRFTSQDASAIVDTLTADFAAEFTSTSRDYAGSVTNSTLGTIDEITFTEVGFGDAITRLMRRAGGYWKVEYHQIVQAFLSDTYNPPTTLTDTHGSLKEPYLLKDNSQLTTRVHVEGHGSQVAQAAAVGATTVAVESSAPFASAGGSVKVPAGQVLTYTGIGSTATSDRLWVDQTTATSVNWTAAAWSPALTLWCVVGTSTDKCITSPEGSRWTERTMANSGRWTGIDWSPSLALFVAVNSTGTAAGAVNTSPDGITWTSRTAAAAVAYQDVVWNADDSLWCAVARDGTAAQQVMTSTDGLAWTARTSSSAKQWRAVTFASSLSLFCAMSNNSSEAMTSPDGITWTTRATNVGNHSGMTWSEELTLFVAMRTITSSTCETSPDGITWTERTMPSAGNWQGVTWSAALTLFVAVATTGTYRVAESADGITWLQQIPANATGQYVAAGWDPDTGRLLAAGTSNELMTQSAPVLPTLTGVPASGTGSIATALVVGDPVNIYITRNDATAQSSLATLLGGSADGIFEEFLQDRRLKKTECENRGDATLTLQKDAMQEFTYACRDPKTRSGKTVTVDLSSPQSIDTTFKIQSVRISEVDTAPSYAANETGHPVSDRNPRYDVVASTARFSFEDLLRQMRLGSEQDEA